MMIRLSSDVVKEHWETIYPCILYALPKFTRKEEKLKSTLYKHIMNDILDVWVYIKNDENDDPILHAVVTTMIQGDVVIGNRDLLIYTFYLLNHTPDALWQDGLLALYKYAKLNKCTGMTAYTQHKRISDFLLNLNNVQKYNYFILPITEEDKQ